MILTRLMSLTGLLIIGAIFIAACGAADDAEVVATPVFEPTAAPTGNAPAATAVPADSVAPTAAPTEAPAAVVGDAVDGETLFSGTSGCAGCHSTSDATVIGPGLAGIGTIAETRVAGESADEYLTAAIIAPNDFLVPDFPGIMPGNFGQSLSEQEVADLVAYLISLP